MHDRTTEMLDIHVQKELGQRLRDRLVDDDNDVRLPSALTRLLDELRETPETPADPRR